MREPELTRFPVAATEADYERASAELEARLGALPGIVAVYRTGSVSAPGISDIDRVAVVEPGSRVPEIWSSLSAETRALAMHGPFLVDTTTFGKLRWFTDVEPLELVSGEAVPVEDRPAPDYVELLIAAESLVVLTLKLVKQTTAARVKVRPTLCELHNLRRDLSLASVAATDAVRAWRLGEQVASLRGDWWIVSEGERRSRFQALIANSLPALADALRALPDKFGEGGNGAEPLALAASWQNVVLVPGEPISTTRSGALRRVSAGSRRAGEAMWRLRRHELPVPPSVLSLLVDGESEHRALREERRRIVGRYDEFLRRTSGYSGISVAGVFQP